MARDKTLLGGAGLTTFLAAHPKWENTGTALRRAFEFPKFLDGIEWVGRIARIAEELDHHPDIDLRWRKVTLTLTTHDAGGLTQRDLELATQIDAAPGGE